MCEIFEKIKFDISHFLFWGKFKYLWVYNCLNFIRTNIFSFPFLVISVVLIVAFENRYQEDMIKIIALIWGILAYYKFSSIRLKSFVFEQKLRDRNFPPQETEVDKNFKCVIENHNNDKIKINKVFIVSNKSRLFVYNDFKPLIFEPKEEGFIEIPVSEFKEDGYVFRLYNSHEWGLGDKEGVKFVLCEDEYKYRHALFLPIYRWRKHYPFIL